MLLLANIQFAAKEYRIALEHAQEATKLSEIKDCNYAWGQADAQYLCGICYKNLEDIELAKQFLSAALEIRTRIRHPLVELTQKILNELP